MTLYELILSDNNIVYASDVSSIIDTHNHRLYDVRCSRQEIENLGDEILQRKIDLIEPNNDYKLDIWIGNE